MIGRILVTGGARSGKSRHAASLVPSLAPATVIAPGRPSEWAEDPDWEARVRHHRASRPEAWLTVESSDVAADLRTANGPVIVDCLGTWLTTTVDRLGLWEAPAAEARLEIDALVAELCAAIAGLEDVVVVTNEVGSGVVPAHPSGSLFRDLLGATNQAVGSVVDEVHLAVCGRILRL